MTQSPSSPTPSSGSCDSTASDTVDAFVDVIVDATDLACPLPLLKAKLALNQLNSGQTVKVMATDAGSVRDFHSFAELSGTIMRSFHEVENTFIYVLQKP